jgi:hypothetical protein
MPRKYDIADAQLSTNNLNWTWSNIWLTILALARTYKASVSEVIGFVSTKQPNWLQYKELVQSTKDELERWRTSFPKENYNNQRWHEMIKQQYDKYDKFYEELS